jgi:hypothetical protein
MAVGTFWGGDFEGVEEKDLTPGPFPAGKGEKPEAGGDALFRGIRIIQRSNY